MDCIRILKTKQFKHLKICILFRVSTGTLKFYNFKCQVSSFMCQVQLSCVKFMFHLDSTQTKFLDQNLIKERIKAMENHVKSHRANDFCDLDISMISQLQQTKGM